MEQELTRGALVTVTIPVHHKDGSKSERTCQGRIEWMTEDKRFLKVWCYENRGYNGTLRAMPATAVKPYAGDVEN